MLPGIIALVLLKLNSAIALDVLSFINTKGCIEASLLDPFNNEKIDLPMYLRKLEIKEYINSVTKINELAQSHKIKYNYETTQIEGLPNNRNYNVKLILGEEMFEGKGSSLRKARHDAASKGLMNTHLHNPVKEKKLLYKNSQTPTVNLNNLAAKFAIVVNYYLVDKTRHQSILLNHESKKQNYSNFDFFDELGNEPPAPIGPFTVVVHVGESQFEGYGHTIQVARHEAAKKAIQTLQDDILNSDDCNIKGSTTNCDSRKANLKSSITKLYELAVELELSLTFNITDEFGKDHQKTFITQCQFGHYKAEGQGNSKKTSKTNSATAMLEKLSIFGYPSQQSEAIHNIHKEKRNRKTKHSRNSSTITDVIKNMLKLFYNDGNSEMLNDEKNGKIKNGKRSQDKQKHTNLTPKSQLLEMSNLLNIKTQFKHIKINEKKHYTLLLLQTQPLHICIGDGLSQEDADRDVSSEGFIFLKNLFNKLPKNEAKQFVVIKKYTEENNNYVERNS